MNVNAVIGVFEHGLTFWALGLLLSLLLGLLSGFDLNFGLLAQFLAVSTKENQAEAKKAKNYKF